MESQMLPMRESSNGPQGIPEAEPLFLMMSEQKVDSDQQKVTNVVREFFPETWLWDIETLKYFILKIMAKIIYSLKLIAKKAPWN